MALVEVQARIATIEARIAATTSHRMGRGVGGPLGAGGAPAATAPSSSTAPSFADLLGQATQVAGPPATSTAPPGWATALPAAGRPWATEIERVAERHGLDARLVAAVAWTESGFRPDATSPAGARGLMQLMPTTAKALGVDPADPVQNLEGGARYLAEQLDRFGRVDLALAAYNAGPTRVARAGAVPAIRETQDYVRRVTHHLQELGGLAGTAKDH